MKKLFTLIAAALMAVGASAEEGKISLNLSDATTGWGELSVDAETGEVTVGDNGAYGWWTSKPDDASYTKLVFEMKDVQKAGWFQLSLSNTDSFPFDDGSYIKVIDVSSVTVERVMFQGGAGTKYTIKEAYFATDAYITTNDVKDEKIYGDTQELSLANLGSGWESEYNPDTKTITITGDDGGGKGWWVKPADYSHFDNFVVEFDPATTVGGQVVVQYVEDPDNVDAVAFYKGATCVVVPLDATKKGEVQQMYIQGAKDATFTLKKAYVAVASATPEANIGTTDSGEEATGVTYQFNNQASTYVLGENYCAATTYSMDGKEGFSVNYTGGSNDNKMQVKLAANEEIFFEYSNSQTKNNAVKTGENYMQCDSKNFVINIPVKTGDVIYIKYSAKGGTAAALDVYGSEPAITADAEAVKTCSGKTEGESVIFKATATKGGTAKIKETSGGMRVYAISINQEPTGIQNVKVADAKSANGAIYNLAGQKVNESYKGIVIKNGKKYIQK